MHKKNNRSLKRLAAVVFASGLLLQIGPCTGDSIRNALGSGARSTLNGLFGILTNSLVTDVLKLP